MVVILVTSCNALGGRPWDRSTRRAYMEDEHDVKTLSTWVVIRRSDLMVTPKTRIVSTRVASGTMGGMTVRGFLLPKMIISRVLDVFSRRLFFLAQSDIPSNSSLTVPRWLDPTNRYVSSANFTRMLNLCLGWRSDAPTT